MGGSVRGSTLVRAQPEAMQSRIRDALDELVEPCRAGDTLEVPVAASIASGRKPGRQAPVESGDLLSSEAAADELDHAGEPLVDVLEAALLQRVDDLVGLEDPHAARALEHRLQRRQRSAGGGPRS